MTQCLDRCGNELTTQREAGGICDACLGHDDADDILIWADGTTAERSDIERGDYAHMSDDYREATEEEIDAMNASLLDTYQRECMHR